jgi:hypothetical protein
METGFVICSSNIGFPLLADSENHYTATNSFELQLETYSFCGFNGGKPISAVS